MEQCSAVLMAAAGYAPGEGGQEDYSCELLPHLGRQNIVWVGDKAAVASMEQQLQDASAVGCG